MSNRIAIRMMGHHGQRIRTTASAARSRDTRISAEVGAYNPDLFDRAWQGFSVAQFLDAPAGGDGDYAQSAPL